MPKHLTQHERYYIWQRMSRGDLVSTIAKDIEVHRSTIYRELKRNKNDEGKYLPGTAELKTRQRRADSKPKFKQFTPQVIEYIATGLTNLWSPEQLSGRMPKDLKVKISHETIYQ